MRDPYISIFQRNLRELFLNNFRTLTDSKTKSSFLRVLQTWQYLLDAELVKSIEIGIFGTQVPKNYGGISPDLLNSYIRDIGAKIPVGSSKSVPQPKNDSESKAQTPALPLEDTFSLLKALEKSLKIPVVTDKSASQKSVFPVSAAGPLSNSSAAVGSIPSFLGQLHQINMQQRTATGGTSVSNQGIGEASDSSFTVLLAASDKKEPVSIPTDYVLSSEFVNKKYKNAHHFLYKDLKTKCSNCGLRFPDSAQGKSRYSAHLDWHFTRNKRLRDKFKRPVSRDWFSTLEVRVFSFGMFIYFSF